MINRRNGLLILLLLLTACTRAPSPESPHPQARAVDIATCRRELWNVSPLTGWLNTRKDAAGEIARLREGLRLGYSAPRYNVIRVIEQASAILARDSSATEVRQYTAFLEQEYLPRVRTSVGVSALPNGLACFDALIQRYTSSTMSAAQVDSMGRTLRARAMKAPRPVAGASPQFHTEREVLAHADSLLQRAWVLAPRYFADLPNQPPPHATAWADADRNSPTAVYVPAEGDSTAKILINMPSVLSGDGGRYLERVILHEGVPGHHLQAIYPRRGGVEAAPAGALNTAYVEGWAVYASNLADEMGLYTSDGARTPLKSALIDDALTMLVQTGLHVHGWTPDQAADTIVKVSAVSRAEAEEQVAYYIAAPAHALAYPVGARTIEALRTMAQKRLGTRFDIREFHRIILQDGPRALSVVAANVENWVDSLTHHRSGLYQ